MYFGYNNYSPRSVLSNYFNYVHLSALHKILLQFLFLSRSREDRVKSLQYYEYTVPNYLPDSFKQFFKVSPETIELLCQKLSVAPLLTERAIPGGRPPISLEKKVLMTIRYLVSQETLKELSDRFGVTEFGFLRSRRQVIQSINSHLLSTVIFWPTDGDRPNISRKFNEMGAYRFPSVIGAIDGTHIQIEAPLHGAKSYYNRKHFHSVVLQAVCVDDLRFTDINVGWPGRVHDAKVLRNSSLWDTGFEKCDNGLYHLLGDGAYPLKEWLITPYRDNGHLTVQQKRFNVSLSSKRQVIERAFGMLKGRFRRLKYINVKSVQEICEIIVATCVLHNICILEHDGLENILENDAIVQVDNVDQNMQLIQNDAQGQIKRVQLTNRL